MGLFKKLTDPSPGGGATGDEPDHSDLAQSSRDQVRDLMADHRAAEADASAGKLVDATALIMGGVAASGRIDAIKKAQKQINLQDTFDVRLTVFPEEGDEFTAHVIQPVAEQYVRAAAEGQA